MKITALVENTLGNRGVQVEHGLSLYIETQGKKILFDMGQTAAFAENAEKLGIDLAAVDVAVLSHGHYDYGGGLEVFRKINKTAPVYLSQYAFQPHLNGEGKNIGLSPELIACSGLKFTGDIAFLGNGLKLYACNERPKKYPMPNSGMQAVIDGVTREDDVRHEQYLLIEEAGKRVLITGCSHKGILDLSEWFAPDVLIGGFHFFKLPVDETLGEYARILNSSKTRYYTCHCTGTEQYAYLKPRMERLEYLACGQSIEI